MSYWLSMKLRPGVSKEAANAELQPIVEQFAKETPTVFRKVFEYTSGA